MVITVAGEKCEVYRLKVSGMVRTFFTRATSQSPCLHETLATAAITSKIREAYFISLTRFEKRKTTGNIYKNKRVKL